MDRVLLPTFIDLNPFELNHYPFMISLGKCNGNYNVVNDLFAKIWVPNKTKFAYVLIEINGTLTIGKCGKKVMTKTLWLYDIIEIFNTKVAK